MVQANDYYVYTHWGGRSWRELDGRARRDDVIDSHDIHEHDRSKERESIKMRLYTYSASCDVV